MWTRLPHLTHTPCIMSTSRVSKCNQRSVAAATAIMQNTDGKRSGASGQFTRSILRNHTPLYILSATNYTRTGKPCSCTCHIQEFSQCNIRMQGLKIEGRYKSRWEVGLTCICRRRRTLRSCNLPGSNQLDLRNNQDGMKSEAAPESKSFPITQRMRV